MSLPANQIKEPGKQSQPAKSLKEPSQEALPVNLLKEPSQESRILCPDPAIVSAPLRGGCSGCPEHPTSNPCQRFPSSISLSAPYPLLVPHTPPIDTLPRPAPPRSSPEFSLLCLLVNFFATCAFPPLAPPSSVQSLICLFLPCSLSSLSLL